MPNHKNNGKTKRRAKYEYRVSMWYGVLGQVVKKRIMIISGTEKTWLCSYPLPAQILDMIGDLSQVQNLASIKTIYL